MAWTTGEANEIREILKMVTETATELPVIREEVADHRMELHGRPGNGESPGALSRITANEAAIGSMQRKHRGAVVALWGLVLVLSGAGLKLLGDYLWQ